MGFSCDSVFFHCEVFSSSSHCSSVIKWSSIVKFLFFVVLFLSPSDAVLGDSDESALLRLKASFSISSPHGPPQPALTLATALGLVSSATRTPGWSPSTSPETAATTATEPLTGAKVSLNSLFTDSEFGERAKGFVSSLQRVGGGNSRSNLRKLRVLNLGFNKIVGEIPGSISSLESLEVLNLASNGLNGSVTGFVGRLRGLYLSFNQFSGVVPREIGENCWKLEHLDLSAIAEGGERLGRWCCR
ncbi:uncharacterized protein HKW66_Vig0078540 [Vigna angularis]|uniref:Leucine-rich repeat-containing N-terminal plant-type domain-containing protein n=1 Tax=Phaseolus angularis TaxID=3914 RepID=A0A8T0K584_PHAAN|nr:uncharacterized protein HKW66_Vig0078540 [Vigna angularis]